MARTGSQAPWLVSGALAIIAIAAVVYAAGKHGDGAAPSAATTASGGTTVAPDISSMTPKEQFNRLIDRVTTAAERGDTATVARFWPMASGAYQNLSDADRDIDARFHMGWLHLLAGQYPEAKAVGDSILSGAPNHLFGLYLQSSVAEARGDSTGAREALKTFRSHFDAEVARKDRPEYAQHRAMLDKFRDAATKP